MIHNDRTLLWSTSGNMYNTTFDLSEPATHFEAIEVYASGKESDANGAHVSKQTFNTQNRKMGCDCFGYSPWVTGCNYVLGSDFTISGKQCYCGSSYYMGMGNNTTAYAAGKWVNADAQKMLQPIKIFGIDRKPTRTLTLINGDHGTISASVLTGCEYDEVTLSNTPDEDWYFLGYNITGATLTGNKFTFGNSDVTAEAVFTDQAYTITYENDGHGTVTGPVSAMPNSTVTLTTAYNSYYRFSGYQVTGGTINGNNLTVTGDCTARAVFKPNAFTAKGKYNFSTYTFQAKDNSHSVNGILTGFTGSKPANWPANNANWNVTNASAYSFTANTTVKVTVNSQYSSQKSITATASLINGSTTLTTTTTTIRVGTTAPSSFAANCSNKTAQGQAKHSLTFHLSTAPTAHSFTVSLPTNNWTATGYAP